MINSVVKAAKILEAVHRSQKGSMRLVDVAKELGMEKATAFNLIKTLLALDYLAQDEAGGEYRLGAKLLELAQGDLVDEFLASAAMQLCEETSKEIGERVMLAACRQGAVKAICRTSCDNEVVVAPNTFKPLYTTVSGRCLLAQLPQEQTRNAMIQMGPPGDLWDGIADMASLQKALAEIASSGYAVLASKERQVGGVGFIIDAPLPYAPLAIGAAMPLFRFNEKRKAIHVALKSCAERIACLTREKGVKS